MTVKTVTCLITLFLHITYKNDGPCKGFFFFFTCSSYAEMVLCIILFSRLLFFKSITVKAASFLHDFL